MVDFFGRFYVMNQEQIRKYPMVWQDSLDLRIYNR
jgi:hypothetical protein